MFDVLPDKMTIGVYAKILVKRHSDIGFISSALKREYGATLPRERLQAMRAEYENSVRVYPAWPQCQHVRSEQNTIEVDGKASCAKCYSRWQNDLRRWARRRSHHAAR